VIGLLRHGMGTQFDPTLLTIFFTVFEQLQDIAALNPDEADSAESSRDSRMNILSEIGCL
jgi:HD-GYP domain-containing protein (c-di-GMP phosphodiesterase class II)